MPAQLYRLTKSPLTLSLSPRGERTLEYSLQTIRTSLLPLGEKDRMRGDFVKRSSGFGIAPFVSPRAAANMPCWRANAR